MRTILFLCLLLTGTSLYAQSGSIQGTVNSSDKQPAELVSVGLKGTSAGTTTDKKGFYRLRDVKPGTYVLVVPVFGHGVTERNVTVLDGQTVTLDLTLSESSETLQEVIISDDANRYTKGLASTGLRLNTPLQELPQNIQVVTRSMLKDQQVISMSDGLVRNVSGLVRMEHWGDMYANITARGAQLQAFRNGFNVVNSYWGPLTEDMAFVDNIEFIKGPAGFMLSNGDPAGLYNVVTKKPTGINKGEVGLTVGSFNLFRTSIDLDGKFTKNGKLLYRINAAAQTKGSHRANEYNNRYAFAPVLSYQLDRKTKLTLEYNYQRADMSNVGSFYVFDPAGFATRPVDFTMLPAGTPGVKIDDHSVYFNLQHNVNDNWKVTAQAARFHYNQIGASMWPSLVNPDGTMIRYIGIWDAASNMTLGQVFTNGKVKTGAVTHNILAGIDMTRKEYLADWSQSHDLDDSSVNPVDSSYNLFDPANPNLGVPVTGYPVFDRSRPLAERAQAGWGYQNLTATSIYLQDEIQLFNNKARLTLAGRYTDISQAYAGPADKARKFTPRLGVNVTVNDATNLYALYDQAFVPQSGIRSDGEKVQPITGNNTELGVKRLWANGRWSTGLTIYRILKNNELIADPAKAPASGLSIEMGQKVSEGLECDVKGTIIPGLNLVANYAFTDSRVLRLAPGISTISVGDVVPGFARHTANVWLTYRVQSGTLKGFGVSAGATVLGDRQTYWDPSPDPDKKIADYYKIDGGISWQNDKINITVNMFNALDRYLYSGSYYSWSKAYYWQTEAPRNFRLSIGYNF